MDRMLEAMENVMIGREGDPGGGMVGMGNNAMGHMSDGMKLGFKEIGCMANRILSTTDQINDWGRGFLVFMGSLEGSVDSFTNDASHGVDCNWDDIPFSKGQRRSRQNQQKIMTVGDNGQLRGFVAQGPSETPNEKYFKDMGYGDINWIGDNSPASIALYMLAEEGQTKQTFTTMTLSTDTSKFTPSPQLATDNDASRMLVIISPYQFNKESDLLPGQYIKAMLLDAKESWAGMWHTSITALARNNPLRSNILTVKVITFADDAYSSPLPLSTEIMISVQGLISFSGKFAKEREAYQKLRDDRQ